MNSEITLLTPNAPDICRDTSICEALRYSGCRDTTDALLTETVKDCIRELSEKITPRAVLSTVSVSIEGDTVDLGFFKTQSRSLRIFLGDSKKAGIFAATLGLGADMLISRYSPIMPSRAVLLDGAAGAVVECLCNKVTADFFGAKEQERFSPGYGDLSLDMQDALLRFLDANLKIGLSATDSKLLTPTKSVTAIVRL